MPSASAPRRAPIRAASRSSSPAGAAAYFEHFGGQSPNASFCLIAPSGGRGEKRRANGGRARGGRARGGRAKSGRAKSGRAKSGRAKSGRAKSGREKSGREKSGREKSGPVGTTTMPRMRRKRPDDGSASMPSRASSRD